MTGAPVCTALGLLILGALLPSPPAGPAGILMKQAELKDPGLLPPSLEVVLDAKGSLPESLVAGGARYEVAKGRAVFDTDGDGSPDGIVIPGEPFVFRIGKEGRQRPVMIHHRMGRWFAGPAALREGRLGKEVVQVLEGDLDGGLPGERDWIRVGDGTAFRPMAAGDLHWSEGRLFRFTFRAEGGATVLDAVPESPPEWATPVHRRAQDRLNSWRRGVGLPPQRLGRERSEGCRLHSEYMALNGVGHTEDKARAGYTPAGAEAGMRSSVGKVGDPLELIDRITATVLHRVTCLGSGKEELGIGFGGGCSAVWGEGRASEELARPCLVPGPGQERVPLLCGSEMPRPDIDAAFYEKERGYPVTVSCDGLKEGLRATSLRLFRGGKGNAVEGFLFTPEAPYSRANSTLATNYGMTMFVAARPLEKKTQYVARFAGESKSGTVTVEWSFRTE